MTPRKKVVEEPKEVITNEELYEEYRAYPVTIERTAGSITKVLLDMRFIQTCHDYGRALAFDGYDTKCAASQANEFIEKLVLPLDNSRTDYQQDLVAKSFGLGFANFGYAFPDENLTTPQVDVLTQTITAHLEDVKIL